MKKYIRNICGALAAVTAFTACDSKLDIHNPNNFSDEQIMSLLKDGTDEQRVLILGGMANGMPGNMCLNNSVLAGGFSNSSSNEWSHNMFRTLQSGDVVYGDPQHTSGWGVYYTNDPSYTYWVTTNNAECYGYWASPSIIIGNANKVLQFLGVDENGEDIVGESKLLKEYKGRCLVVRALGYMQLMERFTKAYLHGGKDGHGMPIYTDFGYNDPKAPATAKETWDFIIKDLKEAEKLFKESGIGSEGYTMGLTNDQVYEIDRAVANYMLARASLWVGDYATVITACQDIMNHYNWQFIKEEHYGVSNTRMAAICAGTDDVKADDNAFLCVAKNPETIFGWTTDASVYPWSHLNALANGSNMTSNAYYQIDNALWAKMADNDYRKERFLAQESDEFGYFAIVQNDTVPWPRTIPAYTNLKWAATIASDESTRRHDRSNSDVVLLRTSEVVLMLAEAQAQSGDEQGAKTTLNKLLAARTKAGTTTLTCDNYPSMQGMSVLDMCKLQWRIECWGENGWKFWNSKRWGEVPAYEGSNHWSQKRTVEHTTWEIPDNETQTNPHWSNVAR